MQLIVLPLGGLFLLLISVISWFESQKCVNKPTYVLLQG